MRGIRLSIVIALAVLASACARQPRHVTIDAPVAGPVATGGVVNSSPSQGGRGLFGRNTRLSGANRLSATGRSGERGLLSAAPHPMPAVPRASYPSAKPSAVLQAPASPLAVVPHAATAAEALAQYPVSRTSSGSYAAYAARPAVYHPSYTLDAGDKLRIVVFGQEGISSSYLVDAGGNVTLPLIGTVRARGATTGQLAQAIAGRLRQGYIRDPKVTVEIEVYRPFFILGEVTTPGQYPYSPNMTAEMAVAIAGGFGPRASKSSVRVTRNSPGQQFSGEVPLNFPLRPGDTVVVKERWF
jgi:polysaccharide export outer membrane protein